MNNELHIEDHTSSKNGLKKTPGFQGKAFGEDIGEEFYPFFQSNRHLRYEDGNWPILIFVWLIIESKDNLYQDKKKGYLKKNRGHYKCSN